MCDHELVVENSDGRETAKGDGNVGMCGTALDRIGDRLNSCTVVISRP